MILKICKLFSYNANILQEDDIWFEKVEEDLLEIEKGSFPENLSLIGLEAIEIMNFKNWAGRLHLMW